MQCAQPGLATLHTHSAKLCHRKQVCLTGPGGWWHKGASIEISFSFLQVRESAERERERESGRERESMRCKSCTSHFWGQFALAMLPLLLLLLPGVVAKSAFHSASIQLENVRAVERIAKRVSNVAKPRNESPVLTKSEKKPERSS